MQGEQAPFSDRRLRRFEWRRLRDAPSSKRAGEEASSEAAEREYTAGATNATEPNAKSPSARNGTDTPVTPASNPAHTSNDETGETESGTTRDSDVSPLPPTRPAGTGVSRAQRNITWFRRGFIAIGILQFCVGVLGLSFILLSNSGGGFVGSPALIAAFTGPLAITSLIPVIIGLGLSRRPVVGWYAGMGWALFQALVSLLNVPFGLLVTAIYGSLVYLGLTGRPALHGVYGQSETGSSELASTTSAPPEDAADISPQDEATLSKPATASGDDTELASQSESHPADAKRGPGAASTSDDQPASQDSAKTATDNSTRSPEQTIDTANDAGSSSPEMDEGEVLPAALAERLVADDPAVRKAAVQDLAEATLADSLSEQLAIDALRTRSDEDNDTDVRVAVCEALGQLNTDRARSTLETYRLDPNSAVSHAASRALRATD